METNCIVIRISNSSKFWVFPSFKIRGSEMKANFAFFLTLRIPKNTTSVKQDHHKHRLSLCQCSTGHSDLLYNSNSIACKRNRFLRSNQLTYIKGTCKITRNDLFLKQQRLLKLVLEVKLGFIRKRKKRFFNNSKYEIFWIQRSWLIFPVK